MLCLLDLDPTVYEPSLLHDPGRVFRESNCYVDVWIELLHAHHINPASAMGFACMVDFEGDQWTFFKPPPEALQRLYGIDVHEILLYRSTVDHVIEHLAAGRMIIIEADSFYMPDTAPITYRRSHVKSSIAVEAIDVPGERLRYFHGPGYYELSGEDFHGLLRMGRPLSVDVLPPYAEVVRFDAGPRLDDFQLRRVARELFEQQLAFRPKRNPWLAFGERLSRDIVELLAATDNAYHAYAFATVRQCGAAFELTKTFVGWMSDPPCAYAKDAMVSLDRQATGAKTLLFKLARRRPFDPTPEINELAKQWEATMRSLDCLLLEGWC